MLCMKGLYRESIRGYNRRFGKILTYVSYMKFNEEQIFMELFLLKVHYLKEILVKKQLGWRG